MLTLLRVNEICWIQHWFDKLSCNFSTNLLNSSQFSIILAKLSSIQHWSVEFSSIQHWVTEFSTYSANSASLFTTLKYNDLQKSFLNQLQYEHLIPISSSLTAAKTLSMAEGKVENLIEIEISFIYAFMYLCILSRLQ